MEVYKSYSFLHIIEEKYVNTDYLYRSSKIVKNLLTPIYTELFTFLFTKDHLFVIVNVSEFLCSVATVLGF